MSKYHARHVTTLDIEAVSNIKRLIECIYYVFICMSVRYAVYYVYVQFTFLFKKARQMILILEVQF